MKKITMTFSATPKQWAQIASTLEQAAQEEDENVECDTKRMDLLEDFETQINRNLKKHHDDEGVIE